MKIVYLHQYFNTPTIAAGTRSYEISRRLVAAGHEVDLITTWREPDERREWFVTEESGNRVQWLPVEYSNSMSAPRRIRAFLRFAAALSIRSSSFDARSAGWAKAASARSGRKMMTEAGETNHRPTSGSSQSETS